MRCFRLKSVCLLCALYHMLPWMRLMRHNKIILHTHFSFLIHLREELFHLHQILVLRKSHHHEIGKKTKSNINTEHISSIFKEASQIKNKETHMFGGNLPSVASVLIVILFLFVFFKFSATKKKQKTKCPSLITHSTRENGGQILPKLSIN